MKRIPIFITLMIVNIMIVYSQDLYFINGHPLTTIVGQFRSDLLKFDRNNKKLQHIQAITTKNAETKFIRPNYDKRIVVALERYLAPNKSVHIHIIDMNKPDEIIAEVLDYPKEFNYISSNLLDINQQGLFLIVDLFSNPNSLLKGVDLRTYKQVEMQPEVYKDVICEGFPGGEIYGGDYIHLYAKSDGTLVIPKTSNIDERPEFPFELPDDISFDENDLITLYVNNKMMIALSSKSKKVASLSELGSTPFYIFNKQQNEWYSIDIDGGRTNIRGFREWIAGLIKEEQGERNNPGKLKRNEEVTATGTNIDFRLDRAGVYCPGRIFAYNIQTKKYYEINTGQADSEILLIEDNKVYYRIYDEIYEADILEDSIGNEKLLVKDKVVPDIHWAFIGGE